MPMETPQGISAARAAADLLPQRLSRQPRFQIPNSGFHSAARHQVPADVRGQRAHIFRARERLAQHPRRHIIAQQMSQAEAGPLLVVEGILSGGDFAPARNAVRASPPQARCGAHTSGRN